ncbi:18130_t:CDS:1, partial [Dentiscutata erythropus]
NSLETDSRSKTQTLRKDNKSKNLINKEFEYLEKIKEHKRSKKNLKFRKQEKLETAVKRRAIAIHYAKVFKSYLDNESDI